MLVRRVKEARKLVERSKKERWGHQTRLRQRHESGAPLPTTCCGTVGIIAGPRAVQEIARLSSAEMAGTGSSHSDPIAIPSSPVTSQDFGGDVDDFPDIDDLLPELPIDLTNFERVPSPLQRSVCDLDNQQYPDWSGIDSENESPGADIPNPTEGFLSSTIQGLQSLSQRLTYLLQTREDGAQRVSPPKT
ncbi:hypothetical protein CHGG_10040 [Chaetomium globosum CBS 148.51]|uniref:Uncharacterized protein n=1 Tax=Chaetomium globosum (strain ATCC 6205 / CBS 148.51 / DSM 1962 / NBRC 6347 / NRRL 1970) TaxID=306901 RepID=Q2GPR4_CHAGB|nr:uncharacterized protein CHGG_10040 [Chaetomium globosum CBS 148.51]EAQ83636.1 hypothetical protein CHGG_10040 [Chaetomium globosum CBS 148.51]